MSEEKKEDEAKKSTFINPVNPDHVAENPHLLPYAHTVGGAVVKAVDKGKIKGRAMAAMVQQTDRQLAQLYKQMQLLADQAKAVQKRVEISEKIYLADMSFEPLISHVYYLYEKEDGSYLVSMIGPTEWGKSQPYKAFLSSVSLLADHTWEVLDVDDSTI